MERAKLTSVLIFVPEITPRTEFVFEFMFRTILGVEFTFTCNQSEYIQFSGPKINYSESNFTSGLFLKAHSILFEKGISKQLIPDVEYNGNLLFFPTSGDSFLPFDPFACVFFLLTRYEEYILEITDEHGRFSDAENLLVRRQLNQKPVVDQIAFWIAEKIYEIFPEFEIRERAFKFLTTIDVDNAWAFKNKKFYISMGAILKTFLHGRLSELKQRLIVLLGRWPDPYDTYDYILRTYKRNLNHLIFFFLLGDRSHFDKNISYKNKQFKQLIYSLSRICPIGIHPSYASNQNPATFEKEKERLEDIAQISITLNRQHYLRLRFPETYKNLLRYFITDDYTMGFASQVGFRAGTCTSFPFFDLSQNVRTDLIIHPFQVMDVSLKNHLGLKPDEAWQIISKLMQEVKKVNGTFISLWHNESLNNTGQWAGWQEVFERLTETGLNYENEQS